jgi:hypothetical protein
MSRRMIALAMVTSVGSLMHAQRATADHICTVVTVTAASDREVSGQAGIQCLPHDGADPSSDRQCTDVPAVMSRSGSRVEGSLMYTYFDGGYFKFDRAAQVGYQWYIETCRDADDGGNVVVRPHWHRTTPPDPAVLLEPVTDEVIRSIPDPTFDINPAERGIYQLGMWLAVTPVEPVVAEARADTVWARATATLTDTTFDMGNGDPITCDGFGDPITESAKDEVEQSPICGYTYTTNPDDVDGYTITVTTRWVVTWELSDGGTGTHTPDITLTTTRDYPVGEIVTTGVSG